MASCTFLGDVVRSHILCATERSIGAILVYEFLCRSRDTSTCLQLTHLSTVFFVGAGDDWKFAVHVPAWRNILTLDSVVD